MEKEKTILNGNKLIAEFMGVTIYPRPDDPEYKKWKGKRCDYCYHEIKYHLSFDWLIPVVEKIESIGYYFDIKRNLVHITGAPGHDPDYSWYGGMTSDTKLISCWYGCIGFIEYYNTKLK